MLFKKVPRGAKIFEANIAKICGKDLSKYYILSHSGQSYKHFRLINYDSRFVIWVFSNQVRL